MKEIILRREKETVKRKEAWQKTIKTSRGQGLCQKIFSFSLLKMSRKKFWFQGECDVGSPKLTAANTRKYTGNGSGIAFISFDKQSFQNSFNYIIFQTFTIQYSLFQNALAGGTSPGTTVLAVRRASEPCNAGNFLLHFYAMRVTFYAKRVTFYLAAQLFAVWVSFYYIFMQCRYYFPFILFSCGQGIC